MAKKIKRYQVSGLGVNRTIDAYSRKQAKLKAGYKAGLGGRELTRFFKSRSVRVTKV